MASSQDIDFQLFVRPKRVPPPPAPSVDGLPVPVDNPYRLPNDHRNTGISGTPHRKASLPASPDIPTIPTVDSDKELGYVAVGPAGPGSKLTSTSTPSLTNVPISRPRAMPRMTPYGGNAAPPKKKSVFGAFTLGRGRSSTYRPSTLSKPVVVVQPGPSVSVHVPTAVAPPPQVEMAIRRSKSAPPHEGRGGGLEPESDSSHAANDSAEEDGGDPRLRMGMPVAVEIVRSVSKNPAAGVTIGEVQIGTVVIREVEPVSDEGTDEGIADVGSDDVNFAIVGEGYDIRCAPDLKPTSFVKGSSSSDDDSSFELVGVDGYPDIDSARAEGESTFSASKGSAGDSGTWKSTHTWKKSRFGTAAPTPESPASSDSALNVKARKQLEKDEAQSRKAMSKILKEESRMEKQSLKIAMTELESLQRAHKESMKLEANAITSHSKTKSEHTKNLSLFEGLKKEYQVMERKVETSAIVLKQADEALEQHKTRVREAMSAVKQKKEEVDILRAQHNAEERERAIRMSGLKKKETISDALESDEGISDMATKQKHRPRFSGIMAPL